MREYLEKTFDQNLDRYLDEWKTLLRFPSISTEPQYDSDCAACAEWLRDRLARMGFDSKLVQTPGKPVVFAERPGQPQRPRVLFYGHYDVQPVDPVEEWQSPPFEPTLRNGRLYARGAEDNKGQHLYVLQAIEALIARDALHSPVKVVIEGEEESGSRGLTEILPDWKDWLASDILLVTDAGKVGAAPTINMGLRGIVSMTVTLSGPLYDLHSGSQGGASPNPAMAMARLLATLQRPDGRVAVAGFYDAVRPPTPMERRLANTGALSPEAYEQVTGVPPLAGERKFTHPERTGFRPTIEVNGLHSGYGGAGMKTIIPAKAVAKLTSRLVPDQDPQTCLDAIVRHFEANAPRGLKMEITGRKVGGAGVRFNLRSKAVARARKVLESLMGQPVVFRWEGGSIPVISALAQLSGADTLITGFGRDEDRVHAPNESFSIEQFRLGFLYSGMLLSSL